MMISIQRTVGVLIPSLAVLFIISCSGFVTCPPQDEGFLPGISGPIVLPLEVFSEDVDVSTVNLAIALWNDRSSIPLFQRISTLSEDCLYRECYGQVIISSLPPKTDNALADSILLTKNGEVVHCQIRMTPAFRPEKHILAHELGHCLGLAHDHTSSSIMFSPAVLRSGTPTKHDILLVLGRGNR